MRCGVLNWKTGCLVSRCSGDPVFPAPSPLPTALGCVVYVSLSCFSLFPFLSISCLGMAGGVSNFSQGIAHTGEYDRSSSISVIMPTKRELKRYEESVPAGFLNISIYFFSLLPLCSFVFVPVSAVHDFRRSSHPHARARRLLTPKFTHARA